ncbi:MAG: 2-phospho-L-lactate guanylyltransferase [Actinomycetia bacterium]|nr:2-phospho-L-lactate guanylyltransferase [Actinomycetes bacterium]
MSEEAQPDPSESDSAAVLVPVKSFAEAKVRLTPALEPRQRADLARRLGDIVLAAAAPLPVAVVCDDPGVAAWAQERGARVIWTPRRGLNAAVADGVAALAEAGFKRVVVAHGDLPLATGFAHLLGQGPGVVLVPDRVEDGTNVLVVPTAAGFEFQYGAASFRRHLAEAHRLGLDASIVDDERLAWDLDSPPDLDLPPSLAPADGLGL